ncbi:MAG: V-type ATPase 116kDa subunit family protein [Candidatus Thorarchaeota archaeon]
MKVAKVVTHQERERDVLMALQEFGRFEFIDVPRQAGIVEIEKTREEETVYTAMDRVTKLIESLELESARRSGVLIEVSDSSLEDSLSFVADVIRSVEEEVLELDRDLTTESQELERQKGVRDVAISLQPLGLDPQRLGASTYTFTTAGVIPSGRISQLEWSIKELTEDAYSLSYIALKRGVSVASVSVAIERREAVERILSAMEFESFSVPADSGGDPTVIAADAKARITELESSLENLHARKDHVAHEWGSNILAAWEVLDIEHARVEAKRYLVYTDQSVKAWGWIPYGCEEALESTLTEITQGVFDLQFDEPDFAEVESPTYLDNPGVMKPTEDVVNAFGTPSKHDIDPTKIMWLSFPLIFGLVFADIGQGFFILLIGLAALRGKRRGDDWGSIMGYVQSGAEGLIMMGIFAIIGGFLFGSFFGAETVVEPLWPIQIIDPAFPGQPYSVFAHYLPDGSHNAYRSTHMLKLSIEIGAIQITIGILLDLYNRLKHHEMRKALVAASYLVMYLGFVNLLFGVSYSSVTNWFGPDPVYLWIPFIGIGQGIANNGVYPQMPLNAMSFSLLIFFAPLILMAITSMKGGMDGMVHFLESALGMISHTVSYARIFALNTVHIILSGVFFSLVPAILYIPMPEITLFGVEIIPDHVVSADPAAPPGPHLELMGAIVGTFIVGILEGLLAFMHTLRLHFVEWFSKFYHAGGVLFAPFTVKRLHTVTLDSLSVAPAIPTN